MTLPSVSVLDAAFVLSVSGVSAITGNALGAGLSMIVGAAYFLASAIIADRRAAPPEAKK